LKARFWFLTLSFYAILRSIPDKVGGVSAMGGALLVLFIIPFTNTSIIKSTHYRPLFKVCYWLFVTDFIILTWVGQKPIKNTYIFIGQVATFYYFFFFVVLIPVVGFIETKLLYWSFILPENGFKRQ
jgi:ubiquinol-cytochrome c reductase cytochrome b subunit